LKKKYSIKENTAVQQILKQGRFYTCASCVVYVMKNGTDKNNVAFLAGKKLGNAPIRNKAKRKLRLAMSEHWQGLSKGHDIVLIARPVLLDRAQYIVLNDLAVLLKKHKILNENYLDRRGTRQNKKIGDA